MWIGAIHAGAGGSAGLASINAIDMISKGGVIGYVIVALSVALLTLSIVLFVHLRYAAQCPDELLEEVERSLGRGANEEAAELLGADPSALAPVLDALLKRRQAPATRLLETLEGAVAEQATLMSQRVAYVGLIAAAAPMLGLLGTVSGMIRAFATMSASTVAPQANELAGAISEALVTTYLGLIVAIPAMGVHLLLQHRVTHIALRIGEMGEQFVETIGPARPVAARRPPRRAVSVE
jgi:biopolymer transport protein ExbB